MLSFIICRSVLTAQPALIDFDVKENVTFNVSSKSSDRTATQLTLANGAFINGSIAYLYASQPLKNALGTGQMSLQDAISGYRTIRPPISSSEKAKLQRKLEFKPSSLYYGRMYFPGSALEAMLIKRFTQNSRLLVKCVSNNKLKNNGTMTFFFQRNTGRLSTEYVYSTNESLLGLRCLYSFRQGAERLNTALYSNSSLSLGAEIWYGVQNMSPGLSTALRYSTESTYTGKPLTMTLACNPILGHISSTYSVKTSLNTTFASRYDFNIYSYDSDLSFGCELWNLANTPNKPKSLKHFNQLPTDPRLPSSDKVVMEAFENLVKETEFNSVLKIATTLNDRNLKFLWEGKYKDFLVSAGVDLQIQSNIPTFNKCGLQVQYAA